MVGRRSFPLGWWNLAGAMLVSGSVIFLVLVVLFLGFWNASVAIYCGLREYFMLSRWIKMVYDGVSL